MFAQKMAIIGSFLGLASVILGSFGAHALKNRLTVDLLNAFEVGVRYQMYHALALLALAALSLQFTDPLVRLAGWVMIAGVLIFSGSLYILSLSGVKFWGAITPIGGVILVLSWLLMLIGLCKS